MALGAVVAFAFAVNGAYAAGPKLQLFSNGRPVPSGQPSAVITQAAFPGFTCNGFSGAMEFQGGPARTLRFKFVAEGGGEAFYSCETGTGERVTTETEGATAKSRTVQISSKAVVEKFVPAPVFEDDASGCVWRLHKLEGPLPGSGDLEGVHVSGTVKLLSRLSAHTCPKTAEATGTVTIEAAPEGAPPGSYRVEQAR